MNVPNGKCGLSKFQTTPPPPPHRLSPSLSVVSVNDVLVCFKVRKKSNMLLL